MDGSVHENIQYQIQTTSFRQLYGSVWCSWERDCIAGCEPGVCWEDESSDAV